MENNYKANFVRKFGELFTSEEVLSHYEGLGIESMEYVENYDMDTWGYDPDGGLVRTHYTISEAVIVHWNGGGEKVIDVSCDSCGAIVLDVIKRLL